MTHTCGLHSKGNEIIDKGMMSATDKALILLMSVTIPVDQKNQNNGTQPTLIVELLVPTNDTIWKEFQETWDLFLLFLSLSGVQILLRIQSDYSSIDYRRKTIRSPLLHRFGMSAGIRMALRRRQVCRFHGRQLRGPEVETTAEEKKLALFWAHRYRLFFNSGVLRPQGSHVLPQRL